MTLLAASTETNLVKFQNLLRELFQFDCANLDFGIYRIMNHKRDVVEEFFTQQLPASVCTELDSGQLAQRAQPEGDLERERDALEQLARSMGDGAFAFSVVITGAFSASANDFSSADAPA